MTSSTLPRASVRVLVASLTAAVLASCAPAAPQPRLDATTTTTPKARATPKASTAPAQKPNLEGKFKAAPTKMNDKQAFTLDFDIKKDTWAVDYTVYNDLTGTSKFVTVRIEGPYEVNDASTKAPGAFDCKFGITKKAMTPHGAEAATALNGLDTKVKGFEANKPLDITTSGFAPFGQYPVSQVGADYDLVKLDGDKLFFGERPADNNMGTPEKRPTKLSTVFSQRY